MYKDRRDAGRKLAAALSHYGSDALVLALPRGGVPVAFEVAKALESPLDVFVVRKLGAPRREELALGAVASGVRVLNDDLIRRLRVSEDYLNEVTEREQRELARREQRYRGERGAPKVQGRTVILVDDGLATGATMRAAVQACKALQPEHLTAAVPVAAVDSCAELKTEVDEVICLKTPENFYGVGAWYEQFSQTSDDEVSALLGEAARSSAV